MRSNHIYASALAILLTTLTGCGSIPYKASTNTKLEENKKQSQQASFELRGTRMKEGYEGDCNPKKQKKVLVLLALSGGGSRAALLSGLSMIEMQTLNIGESKVDLLSEVDLISSVSGGSLPAAYYASTGDPDPKNECGKAASGRIWSKSEVTKLMGKNYLLPWIGNWFWPDNILHYWFSTYDRTDMMAQTFADNLFDASTTGSDLRLSGLNPARPNLIINATQGSINSAEKRSNSFGQPFTFTKEDFEMACSSIDDYDLSRAVMASATFPGVFNFMTLRNHCDGREGRYIQLFDGGNSDNLGLTSIKREIFNLHKAEKMEFYQGKKLSDYKKIIVILVDAYTDSSGVKETSNDPRHWYDYIVDTNFITATDSLLAKNRDNLLTQFESKYIYPYSISKVAAPEGEEAKKKEQEVTTACNKFLGWENHDEAKKDCDSPDEWDSLNKIIKENMEFVHIKFDEVDDPDLRNQLNNIATSFKLDDDIDDVTRLNAQEAITCAVPTFFGKESECINKDNKSHKYKASKSLEKKWLKVIEAINNTY